MIDEKERAWLESLMSRVRAIVERVASGSATSEYAIDVQRLRGRRVRLQLVADVVTDDADPLTETARGRLIERPTPRLAWTRPDGRFSRRVAVLLAVLFAKFG